MDLTNEWEEGHQNGNQREYSQNRRGMSNGGSQDDRREQFYQYRNGNVSREDFGEELRRGRSEVTVISNAVLNHLTSQQRRPTNRVRFKIDRNILKKIIISKPFQSSNLLSAVLCLVKELDCASLEVVEHAVRCRIDELTESM